MRAGGKVQDALIWFPAIVKSGLRTPFFLKYQHRQRLRGKPRQSGRLGTDVMIFFISPKKWRIKLAFFNSKQS
jgi:hypothetical protein